MKNIKLLLVICFAAFSFVAFSQSPAKFSMGKFKKEMNLSKQQAISMKQALKSTKKALKMLKKDKSIDHKASKMRVREIKKNQSNRLKDILNEEQYARFEEINMGSRSKM